MKKLVLTTLILFILPPFLMAHVLDNEKSIQNLLVMINASLDDTTPFGSGIIIGAKSDKLYIATSDHLVRVKNNDRLIEATDIKVSIKGFPGEFFPAELPSAKNDALDLAVLTVAFPGALEFIKELRFDMQGDLVKLNRGDDVYLMGNPNQKKWDLTLKPLKIDEKKNGTLEFQTADLDGGYSGGVLLNGDGFIVGQISRHDARYEIGTAYAIDQITDWFKRQGFPVNLKPAGVYLAASNDSPKKDEVTAGTTTKPVADKVPNTLADPRLRSEPVVLSMNQARAALLSKQFYDISENPGADGYPNDFQDQGEVVIDRTSQLMWQKSGSNSYKNYYEAQNYINELNSKKWAGYNDWRLPTFEEAMSLMEKKKQNGVYINPLFNSTKHTIWTADTLEPKDAGAYAAFGTRMWDVIYLDGGCTHVAASYDQIYVRAVRTLR